MNEMNATIIINLYDLLGDSTAFGNDEGREVYQKLCTEIDKHPQNQIWGISLQGISRTDASFPRESVISLAKARRGEKGFFLLDFASKDLRDNWDYAAKAKEQPMIVLEGANSSKYELIGPIFAEGTKPLLDFIMQSSSVTTARVADHFGISAQNASAKLKKLNNQGLLIGTKSVAESGGIEFVYTPIRF